MSDLKNKFRGALLGAAVGDGFGAPIEGASADFLRRTSEQRAATSMPWSTTDDTHMLLDVANWLVADSCAPDALLGRLAGSFEPALGYGHGTSIALEAFRQGRPWGSCPFLCWPEGSRGNGSTARVAPVALRFLDSPNLLRQYAALSSWVTHAHPSALAGATLQAEAVAILLVEHATAFDARRFVTSLSEDAPDKLGWVSQTFDRLRTMGGPAPLREASAMPLAEVSLPIALSTIASTPSSFESAILEAASMGGDVDTNCAITGALAGALFGVTGIPARWIENLQTGGAPVDALIHAADKLLEMRGGEALALSSSGSR